VLGGRGRSVAARRNLVAGMVLAVLVIVTLGLGSA
jgi:hypothetical protein